MTTDDLRAVLAERPFRPFSLHMSDGRQLAVPTAHFMAIRHDSSLAFMWKLHNGWASFIDVDQVERLEFETVGGR